MLVVTTTMGVLHRVHGDTADLGPAISFHPVLVIRPAGFQHRFVEASTTSNDTNGGTAATCVAARRVSLCSIGQKKGGGMCV